MELELLEHQKIIRDSARGFLSKEMPLSRTREVLNSDKGMPVELWKRMADLGWLGLIIPEKYGGRGGDFLDLAVLLVEMGRAYVPGPYLETMVSGAIPIIEHGTEEQKEAYLPAIAQGESTFSLAMTEEGGDYDSIRTRVRRDGQILSLNGVKCFVSYGQAARYLLVVAKDESLGKPCLAIVESTAKGIKQMPVKSMTPEFYCDVTMDNVPVHMNALMEAFPDRTGAALLIDRAAVARCAYVVGLAEHILDITVEYAKTRVQFDKPIGSFQAIQHHCANMLHELDGCRLLTYDAAWRISQGLPFAMEAAMAKSWCGQSFKRLVGLAHQVHGGVGFIEDHELPLYYRYAWSTASIFGDAQYHNENVIKDLVRSGTLYSYTTV